MNDKQQTCKFCLEHEIKQILIKCEMCLIENITEVKNVIFDAITIYLERKSNEKTISKAE